jgi:hypothetical protein
MDDDQFLAKLATMLYVGARGTGTPLTVEEAVDLAATVRDFAHKKLRDELPSRR